MKKISSLILCAVLLFCACGEKKSRVEEVFSKEELSYEKLPDKCMGWGFRRGENGPEFTEEQIKQMESNGCIYRENTDEKNIYLTFDEGYENGYTSIILDTLREKSVTAAFFVTGPYVKENPDLIERMSKEGHIIGNHTVNHPSLPSVTDLSKFKSELFELDRLVYGICGEKLVYLRPPKGEYSERTLKISKDLGYTNVFWSQAYVDWNDNVTKDEAFEKVTKNLHSGCVLLLHAVSKGNADALGEIIEKAQKDGYVFKSLDDYKK